MASTKVGTGDILLSNWVTPLGQIAQKSGQRWSHAAMILVLDAEVKIVEISFEQGKVSFTDFNQYIKGDPRLEEIAIRRLKKELTPQMEDLLMSNITDMSEEVTYPTIGQMLGKLMGVDHHSRKSICSEFVVEALRRTNIVNGPGLGHHFDGYTKVGGKEQIHHFPVVLPDHLRSAKDNGTTLLDAVYQDNMKIYTMNKYTPDQRKEILKPQLSLLMHMLM